LNAGEEAKTGAEEARQARARPAGSARRMKTP
jgi:hypothetical protein